MPDYSSIDHSPLLSFVFYPRPDVTEPPRGAFDLSVPVEPEVHVSCRFYIGKQDWPVILYFHGNGEVVSDYDHIAPLYNQRELNLVVADYRGYGASTGSPTLSEISKDCHLILAAVKDEIFRRGLGGGLWLMGRSLGSLSAIELAHRWKKDVRGLIIESGFVTILPVMEHLGLPVATAGIDVRKIEEDCLAMVREITLPALVMHGEDDTLVPLREARRFYDNLGSVEKKLFTIPGADHNDIMFVSIDQYFGAIREFIQST